MKIFAVRDRMLDYFQVPVVVHREQDLIAAIARGINGEGDDRNELAQAPDHYELWLLAEVDDQGRINEKREFIANCASFVRNGVWARRKPGPAGTESEPGAIQGRPGRPVGPAGTRPSSTASEERAASQPHPGTDPNAGGGNTGGNPPAAA